MQGTIIWHYSHTRQISNFALCESLKVCHTWESNYFLKKPKSGTAVRNSVALSSKNYTWLSSNRMYCINTDRVRENNHIVHNQYNSWNKLAWHMVSSKHSLHSTSSLLFLLLHMSRKLSKKFFQSVSSFKFLMRHTPHVSDSFVVKKQNVWNSPTHQLILISTLHLFIKMKLDTHFRTCINITQHLNYMYLCVCVCLCVNNAVLINTVINKQDSAV